MRIALLANQFLNPDDCTSWSGLPFFMRRALESAGIETITVSSEDVGYSRRWARFLYWRWFHGKRYLKYCDPELLASHARQAERRLASISVDAVFSPSTWPLAYLETRLPVVLWTDACFAGVLDFYDSFSNLAPASVRAGHLVEQRALDRCTRAIYSTAWAAETALRHYRVDRAKIAIVPFGGNLQEPPTLAQVTEIVRDRPMEPLRLLLVGVDWRRKGVDIAIAAAAKLNEAGVDCRLTVAGCRPPNGIAVPPFVEVIPFLNKASLDDRRRLNELYARSHFFIMPTRAEAFGIVFAEASAFGVPCLATSVGGLPSVIVSERNGELFPLEATGADYADWILRMIRTPERYRALTLRTAEEGAVRLSWSEAGRKAAEILAEVVQPRADSPRDELPVSAV
jgi:glycosyltransferase involved in cell wall biosynthesis